ncbi:MAG: MlaE family lipid ABC transporter permease subunit [Proteobacteria bacterium]|nr:MlaE family lipid ABC transporter permease subunit [Pseudomonadota bacterium]MBU1739204.1 MlaE family lipid ABC transporter permease subunit [Pseudomonadota bacterium]
MQSLDFAISVENRSTILHFSGCLCSENLSELIPRLEKTLRANPADLVIDLAGLAKIDDPGVAVIATLREKTVARGGNFSMRNVNAEIGETLTFHDFDRYISGERKPLPGKPDLLSRLGDNTYRLLLDNVSNLTFLGATIFSFFDIVRHPSSLRKNDTIDYMKKVGVDALPIVGLISFLLGLIMAFTSSVQLQQFGANIYVASLVSLSMTRELGPIITAIVVAGRSSSAFAAEIGSMKISDEIAALKIMGFDPVIFLVLPKMFATILMVPFLTLFSDIFAIAGGLFVGVSMLDLTTGGYLNQTIETLDLFDVYWGVFKSGVFALFISWIGCLKGFQVTSGAAAVGQATTSAVVSSIFMIILVDSIFAVLLTYWG